jgi:peptidyl-prolyl cis-trans isomerase A (cyclophilin A)/peptidyl-prolyl cis-trans isomerase B (cyclophilin B)
MSLPYLILLTALLQAPTGQEPAAPPTPTPTPVPNGPVVVLETSLGPIKIGLHQDKAPNTVANFLQYVRDGHYDGTIFHRVIADFMIQGGGYDAELVERSTREAIHSEARNGLRNVRGAVAMARVQDPNSARAQFFINLKTNHALDFGISGAGYTVFGQVLEGMDVVDRISRVPTTVRRPHQHLPRTPVVIERVRILEPAPKPEPAEPEAEPEPEARPEPDGTGASF